MKKKTLLALFVLSLLLAAVLWPSAARMQGRGLTTGAAPVANAGRYYALVIGNNAYTSLPKLKTAEADAREVEKLLREALHIKSFLHIK